VELLDHPLLARELKLLERRPRVGGRTIVDHPDRSGHDDYANALSLAAAEAIARPAASGEVIGVGHRRSPWSTSETRWRSWRSI